MTPVGRNHSLRGRNPVKPFRMFRIYPNRKESSLFVHVKIFKNVATMHEYLQKQGHVAGRWTKGHFSGWKVCQWKRGCRVRVLPILGEIALSLGWVGTEVTTHEIAHAVFYWAKRMRLFDIQRGGSLKPSELNYKGALHAEHVEEQCCYAFGRMCREMVDQMYRHGIYKASEAK